MNYVEYGKENSDVIILLHGGGLSWWNYKEVAERLQTDYHVVLPILDGHAGCDKQFTTIENNALDIIEFVNSKLGDSVLMMGGLSLGGQILLEILSQRKDICKYAIVETVVLLSQQKPDDTIEIDLDLDELDATSAELKATYQEIKDYVLKESGLKVSSLYISQVKRKCGIEVGENYNLPKSENARVPQCPKEKEDAIKAALKYFAMI